MTTRERRRKTAEALADILEAHYKQMTWKEALTIYRAAIQLRGPRPKPTPRGVGGKGGGGYPWPKISPAPAYRNWRIEAPLFFRLLFRRTYFAQGRPVLKQDVSYYLRLTATPQEHISCRGRQGSFLILFFWIFRYQILVHMNRSVRVELLLCLHDRFFSLFYFVFY